MPKSTERKSSLELLAGSLGSISAEGSTRAWVYLVEAARELRVIDPSEHLLLLDAPHRVRRPRPRSQELVVACERPAQYERCKATYGKLEAVLKRMQPQRQLRVTVDFQAERVAAKALEKVTQRQVEQARWDQLKGSDAASRSIEDAGFLHSYLAQVGLPRSVHAIKKRSDGTRENYYMVQHGRLTFSVAGGVFGKELMPVPYGTKPRLMLFDVCSQAVRRKTRTIDLGNSAREYLKRIGLGWGGGSRGDYTRFRMQALALSVAGMYISWDDGGTLVQFQGMPITQFRAWRDDGMQRSLWPGELVLSTEFYESLLGHALPMEREAYLSLSSSALAMDWHAFLCYYLPRVRQPTAWRWGELHAALGHGQGARDFRRASLGRKSQAGALAMAVDAYPAAQQMEAVEVLPAVEGVRFRTAAPAIRRVAITGT